MKRTTKKNLLATLLVITAVALLLTGIFAFFSDRATVETTGTAGIVDVDAVFEENLADLANINPGDHDWDLATYLGYADWTAAGTNITPGTEHPIELTVTNLGNKSVKVRHVIDLTVDAAFHDDDFMFFLTSFADRTDADAGELVEKYFLFGEDVTQWGTTVDDGDGYYTLDENGDPDNLRAATLVDCTGVRYIVFDTDLASGHILMGVGNPPSDPTDAPEQDPAIDGALSENVFTYYLGLKAAADNRYQDAEVTITWTVEAIQHRNTDAVNAWTKISSATTTGHVPAQGEYYDGSTITP